MKNRIINGNPLEFFNSSNEKKGEIKISGSDIIINPLDSSGTVIFGEEGTINDIEIGGSGTPVDFTFLGGGTIAANGNTITIGESGDTIDLSNATIGTITASIFKGGAFEGDGSSLTNLPSAFTHITASGNISASGTGSFDYLMLGGATSLTEASTRLEVTGQINVGGNGSSGIVRAHSGKFGRITNRNSGNHIIEFSSDNNVNILGPITASIISASGMGTFAQVRIGESTTTNYGLIVDYPDTRLLRLKRGGSTKFQVIADNADGQVDIYDNSGNSDIRFLADGDSYITDNLGIGTTTPSSSLQVGSLTTSVYGVSGSKLNIIDTDRVLSEIQHGTLNLTGTSKLASSQAGFGPSITFTQNVSSYVDGYEKVIGGIKSYITTDSNTAENSSLGFYTHNATSLSEKVTITDVGNLGIGTTTPGEKLTVAGNISASGRVYGTHFGTGNANRNALDLGTDNTMQFRVNDGSRLTLTQTVFRPSTDEAVALGRTAQKWSELVVNHVTASGNISASGDISATNITSSGHIVPSVDNAVDLGTTNSKDFRNLYVRAIDIHNQRINISPTGTTAVFADHSSVGDGFQFMHLNQEILRLGNDGHYTADFTAAITASGDISSSGDGTFNKLFVKDTYALELQATSAGPRIFFGSNTDADAYMSFGAFGGNMNNLDTETRDFHIYGSNTTTGFYFDESAGKFGIGTTTPPEKLTVVGDISASVDIHAQQNIKMGLRTDDPKLSIYNNVNVNNLYTHDSASVNNATFVIQGGNWTHALKLKDSYNPGSVATEDIADYAKINGGYTHESRLTLFTSTSYGGLDAGATTTIGTATSSLPGILNIGDSINFNTTTGNTINSVVNLILNADSDANSSDAYRNTIFQNRGTEVARIDVAGNITASGDMVLQGTAPTIRIQDTRQLNNPDWDSVSLGNIEFYSSDTTSPGARVLSEIEAFSNNAAASGPNSDLIFKTSANTDSSPQTRLTIGHDGTATFTGNIVGTLGTAAQANITSLGTLTGLTAEGNISASGNLSLGNGGDGVSRLMVVDSDKQLTLEKSPGGYFTSFGYDSNQNYITYYSSPGMLIGYGSTTGAAPTVETLFLKQDGNVGIGTTTPSAPLHVSGSTTPKVIIEGDDGAQLLRLRRTDANAHFDISLEGNDLRFNPNTLNNSMNVLFGVSNGSAKVASRVGIGQPVPQSELDVSGSVIVTGDISASGAIDGASLDINGNADISGDLTVDNITSTANSGDASIYINSTRPTLGFTDTNSFTDANDIYLIRGGANILQFQYYDNSAGSTTETFNITSAGNATFAGTVTANGTTLTGATDISGKASIAQLNASSSTLQTNIDAKQATISSGNRLNANLIGSDGSIGNTEFGRLNGVDFNIKTEVDGKASIVQLNASSSALQSNIDGKLAKSSNLSDLTNAGTARTNLGVDPSGTDNSTNVTLAGSLNYITISGQEITRNAIDLAADVTGVLPSANLDSDTAHLTGTQTFSGAKTFSSNITANGNIVGDNGTNITGINSIEVGDAIANSTDNTTKIAISNNTLEFLIADDTALEIDANNMTVSKNIIANSNISASGNISSSGTILGLTGSFQALVGDTSQGTSLEVAGPITGSIIKSTNDSGFVGTPLIVHQFMAYLPSFTDGNFYYGHNTYGPYHHVWTNNLSSEPTDMSGLGAARHAHFMHIVPVNMKNISLKGTVQASNTAADTVSVKIYKTTRSNSATSTNSTLTLLGTATSDNIDNVNHCFNMDMSSTSTINAGEALVLLLIPTGTSCAIRANWTLYGYTNGI